MIRAARGLAGVLFGLLLLHFSNASFAWNINTTDLHDGDIVVRRADGMESFVALEVDGKWTHVGILHKSGNEWLVITSYNVGKNQVHGVQEESLDDFLGLAKAFVVVRITENADYAENAVKRALAKIGVPYNKSISDLGDDRMTCVALARYAYGGIFKMTSIDLVPIFARMGIDEKLARDLGFLEKSEKLPTTVRTVLPSDIVASGRVVSGG